DPACSPHCHLRGELETFGLTPWWVVGGLTATVLLVLAGRWLVHLFKPVHAVRARQLCRLKPEPFEDQLLKAAAPRGLPRGVPWGCAMWVLGGDGRAGGGRQSGRSGRLRGRAGFRPVLADPRFGKGSWGRGSRAWAGYGSVPFFPRHLGNRRPRGVQSHAGAD